MLNVNYLDKGCGAEYYRNWQYRECQFTCDGVDEPNIPNYRRCTGPSKTLVDTPYIDGGKFRGVAFDITGDEVVIRSQSLAGWYRYTAEWRLAANGTIMPRWGFARTLEGDNPCLCRKHHHHVYWRLDFDIETSTNNIMRECDGANACITTKNEMQFKKISGRRWEVANTRSNNYYQIFAGPNDGKADTATLKRDHPDYPEADLDFGVGDLWLVKYDQADKRLKYDDGLKNYAAKKACGANFNSFMKGDNVKDKDIVVWYSAHFMHDQKRGQMGDSHVVGPNLVLGQWRRFWCGCATSSKSEKRRKASMIERQCRRQREQQ
jgi:hypothetical protein